MSNIGEILFDRSSADHEEIWDDTELIQAYDRAQREIRNRLRNNNSKSKKDNSKNKTIQSKSKQQDFIPSSSTSTTITCPTPIPIHMINPPKDEQDAFHSMLMAWYMAGYHAGQLAAKTSKKDN